ncbi:uncharacterized protein [Drosophila tropicalis]|uniref:uncharacterized protein n=1 Tax=Drosophila tropicalis TaxID=46794 RepID=UPI0035ABB9B1
MVQQQQTMVQQQPQSSVGHPKEELPPLPVPVKRSNVTKIARMFETGNTSSSGKPTTRVSPLTLPEIRMFGASEESNESTPCASRKSSIASHLRHIEQAMLQLEEELQNHHHQPQTQQHPTAESVKTSSSAIVATHSDWEPMAVPVLRHGSRRGTSATPSTASPLSSSSPEPPASPVMLRQPTDFCLDLSMENIFQAIARSAEESDSLSPVTCIDDILSERRFSRPLSAYSITDLLNEELASSNSSSTCHHLDEATYVNDAR